MKQNGLILKIPSFWLGIFSLAVLVFTLRWQPAAAPRASLFLAPPEQIEHLVFGFQESAADALWIRAIQDFDFCEKQVADKVCVNNTWVYKMLDAITNLSPHFRAAYLSGSLALTILVNDQPGASQLFEKGVAVYPNDWRLLYYAGYHFLYETPDYKKAAAYLERSAQNGGPLWLNSLAGRLYVQSGNRELAEELLRRMISEERDPALIQRMREKMEDLDSK